MSGNILKLTKADGTGLAVPYRGNPILQGIAEFNSAVRLGSPGLDDRNLASFVAFEDGRGGVGQRYGDVREDLDKVWDNAGADLRRFHQFVAMSRFGSTTLTGNTKVAGLREAVIIESAITGTMRYWAGYGGRLFYSNTTGHTMTKTTNDPGGDISAIMEYAIPAAGATSPAGTRFLLVGRSSGLATSATPTTGAWSSLAVGATGLFVFDGKAFAMGTRSLKWSIDPETAAAWTTVAGNWPNTWKFIGVFAFGDQNFLPYVLVDPDDPAQAKIAVLDPDAATLTPLDLGITGIIQARAAGGQIAIIYEGGKSILLLDPFSRQLRDLDWRAQARHGFNADREQYAIDLVHHQAGLFVAANRDGKIADGAGGPVRMWLHSGEGWHPFGTAMFEGTGSVGDILKGLAYVDHLSAFVMPMYSNSAGEPDIKLLNKPWYNVPFVPGEDFPEIIQASLTNYVVTPWIDMGFASLTGPLLAMHCGGFFDANNRVKVEYQIDEDESSWTLLGRFPNTGVFTPEITGRGEAVEAEDRLLFNGLFGVPARTVRVRINNDLVDTDGNGTPDEPYRTSNAYPLTLQFLKRPGLRDSLRFEVDVHAMLGQDKGVAGVQDVITDLRTMYDAQEILKVEWAGNTTYAFLTSFPRVFQVGGGTGSPGQVALDDRVTGGNFVITMAEPL